MFKYVCSFLSLDNLSVDERIYKDVQDLVFQRIRGSVSLQKNITPVNLTSKPEAEVSNCQTSFAHYVIQASRGNFLFAEMVLRFFEDGKLQVKSASFSMIPTTLSEVFLLAFNLKYQTKDTFAKVKDLIAILAASLRPLSTEELYESAAALKVEGMNRNIFDDKLESLRWLLKQRSDGTWTFFHSSVRDWLIGRRSTADASVFVVDPREGHAGLALRLSRKACQAGQPSLDAEQTLELGHHLLKANLFSRSGKDHQATWISMSTEDSTKALSHIKNIVAPNVKVSRLLLLSGASPDGASVLEEETLVHKFAARGNLEMVQLLIEFGANVNLADNQGMTCLMKASQNGHLAIVALLVKSGADLTCTDSKGSTCLVYAAKSGHSELLQYLLSLEWGESGILENTAQEALVIAAKEGHLVILDMLLQQCKQISVNKKCLLTNEFPLTAAASNGQMGSCNLLIKAGADVNAGASMLAAVKEGHYAIVDLLLKSGAKIEGSGCVSKAAAEGQVGVLELLLTRSSDKGQGQNPAKWALESADEDGLTPAAWAVMKGQDRALDLLVKAGADLNTKDNHKRSLLHHASLLNDPSKILEILLNGIVDIGK